MATHTALIMAGGVGERFWPRSRKSLPKQFLHLTSPKRTMLQMTVDRILPIIDIQNVYIATNAQYQALVKEQLPELPEQNVICEPVGRNTAPCIGLAAQYIQHQKGNAVMTVLPSDHMITQEDIFRDTLSKAIALAEQEDTLITLGVSPSSPETGYGYIRYSAQPKTLPSGVYHVDGFVEKPNLETAKQYLSSGNYLWNSGMFVWSTASILSAIEKNMPNEYLLLGEIAAAFDTPEQDKRLKEVFPQMRSISIDYGVMEHAENICIIPAFFGWDDVGAWNAVARFQSVNDHNNAITGDVVCIDTDDCIIQGGKRLIATVGLDDLIVVDAEDSLLICKKEDAGKIKKVIEVLRATNRTELL